MDLSEFFAGRDLSMRIFDQVLRAARAACGPALGSVELRVTKSQVALVRNKPFAWVWIPAMYLSGRSAPLVLTFSYRGRREWHRWKEIYEAAPGRFTHHLELWTPEDVDEEVQRLVQEAWDTDAAARLAPTQPDPGKTPN